MKPYYDQDGITIYHGDCREILPALPKVDLVLTDPPYGIKATARGTIGTSKKGQVKDYGRADWDNQPPPEWVLGLIRENSQHQIIFGGNYFHLPPSSCWLVWDKDNSGDFADAELAWTNIPKAVRLLKWRWNGMLQEDMAHKEYRDHPTQKPVAVMSWCLTHVPEAKTCLDPFMGSGTTLVACKRVGIACTGIEREERYCEIAAKRLAQGVLWGAE